MTGCASGSPRGARIALGGGGLREGADSAPRAASASQASAAGGGAQVPAVRHGSVDGPNKFQPIECGLPLDLFGCPVEHRLGRPRHLPSEASRALVAKLREGGATQVEIAEVIGLSLPTLRLNYPTELGSGSSTWRRRAADNSSRPGGATEGSK